MGRGYEREILVTRKNKGSEGKRRSIYREGFGRASVLPAEPEAKVSYLLNNKPLAQDPAGRPCSVPSGPILRL